ncbi:2-C-methyl-D-erythritol 4-phosphate cytidylyltransferase [Undibacterium cyanobacteriorum]|uniref:2-C-methyl-D-erythritol 4-phosphate cytidylyltransferase n=1 Tax=Undibacterium cyanobacteriorum TaxID=3073561 RepID=A0ABY9RCK1_9BURK|nr:2-C-methyl-D-erythritol 4-phosphate cytidylyltransferase [Undibacterium sp. 20NA77.5]WMW78981.1 2-C-methyl-D-erythritol 4-phosphate cytidylyltransferase [Undibacterium sp. 20NA77.5]
MNLKSSYFVLIPAAGVGARMGSSQPKQYLQIDGVSVLQYAVNAFLACAKVSKIFVVVSANDAYIRQHLIANERVEVLYCGGATRAETVSNGLQTLLENRSVGKNDWMMVHDAARPGLTPALVEKLIKNIPDESVGGLLAQPVIDTVKQVLNGRVHTIPRETIWLAQTPQMFRSQNLLDALKRAPAVTDEASAIEFAGGSPILVESESRNRKLTRPEDLDFFKNLLSRDGGGSVTTESENA